MATFRELSRIEKKARQDGLDALERWERDALWEFRKAMAPFFEALRSSPAWKELTLPESTEGLKQWEALPAEQREKYGDWTPRQFYAMKLLIDDLEDES